MGLQKGDATVNCTMWSELPADLLELILKRVGVIEFFMFACVCKSWRSVAIAFKQEFMASQAPLVVLMLLTYASKYCYFYNIFDKRLYKTTMPHLTGNDCLGFTCGYLVIRQSNFRRRKTCIWFVNPFTRHELKFPSPPNRDHHVILASLAKSDSDFVAVAFSRRLYSLQFCRSRDVNWTVLNYLVLDVVFKGKIYVLSSDGQIGTLNLNSASVTSLHVKTKPSMSDNDHLHLVVSNEKLYLADFSLAQGFTKFYKLDFERLKWEKVNLKDEVLFLGHMYMKCCGLSFIPPSWEHFDKRLNRVFYLGERYSFNNHTAHYVAGRSTTNRVPATPEDWKPDIYLRSPFWYFPHLSSNVDSVYED